MSDRKTQCERILAHLKAGHRLTPFHALTQFGCFRLAARVHDLREEGHKIQSRNLHQNGRHFAEYWIP